MSKDNPEGNQDESGIKVDQLVIEKLKEMGWSHTEYNRALQIVSIENGDLVQVQVKDQSKEVKKYIVKGLDGKTNELTQKEAERELDRLTQVKMLERDLDYKSAFKVMSLEKPELFQVYMRID